MDEQDKERENRFEAFRSQDCKVCIFCIFFEKEKLQGTVRSPNKGNGRGGVVTSTSLNPANDMALTGSNLVQKGEEEERCLQQTTEC